jgi:hypothetical protein
LKTTKDGRKVIYIDVSKVAGKPVLSLPEALSLNIGPELLLGKLESFIRSWLEQHHVIDAIVLTEPKLYINSMGIPYAITLEQKSISSYVTLGWTIIMPVIPVPSRK